MSTKTSFVIAALVLSASLGFACQEASIFGQQDRRAMDAGEESWLFQDASPVAPPGVSWVGPDRPGFQWNPSDHVLFAGREQGKLPLQLRLQAAAQELKQIQSDEQKQEKIAEIKKMLDADYEDYLKSSEARLEEMEKRLEKLRDQVTRRRTAKDRMVDLQLEMIVSRAEGIGWPESSRLDNPFIRRRSAPAMRPGAPQPTAPAAGPTPLAPAVRNPLNPSPPPGAGR